MRRKWREWIKVDVMRTQQRGDKHEISCYIVGNKTAVYRGEVAAAVNININRTGGYTLAAVQMLSR